MNVLITGGAGYIGSVVTSQVIDAHHHVVLYDDLSHGHKKAIHPQATFIQGNLSDKELLLKTLKDHQIEAVIHFAAFIEAGESMQKPEKYFRNNTVNTLNLLEALIETHVNQLVFSSTAAVYGNPETTPITEDMPLQPTNAYGESKLMVEHMLRWFNQIHGLKYTSLRYFNASGATDTLGEDHQPETHLIPLAIAAVMGKRDALKLFGTDYPTPDGTCIRDYIHVEDLATAHVLALENMAKTSGQSRFIYNLGSEKGFSNREVIEAVGQVAGKPVPYEEALRRPGDPAILVASSQKIQRELGWKPTYKDIKDIITSAWNWKQKNPNGYEN